MGISSQDLDLISQYIAEPQRCDDLMAVLSRGFANDPDIGQAKAILERIFRRKPLEGIRLNDSLGEFFIRGINSSLTRERAGAGRVLEAPIEADELSRRFPLAAWSMPQVLNYALLLRTKPSRRSAVAAAMRDDGISILEWIAYYRLLGFERIFIYTNDNIDGSDELLFALARAGVITLIWNRTSGTVPPNRKAFEHSLQFLRELREYKWVFYADTDEFLQLAPQYANNINNFISAVEVAFMARLPSAVAFRWRHFGSGNRYKRENGLLLDKFQHAEPWWLMKSLVRISDVTSMCPIHFPEMRAGGFMIDAEMVPLDMAKIWQPMIPTYENGCIRHYWNKSFEEFSVKKARGDSLAMNRETADFHRDFSLFFTWNIEERADNRVPAPAQTLQRVKSEIQFLKQLPGVNEASTEIERRFPDLIARYDEQGGLHSIYKSLLPKTP